MNALLLLLMARRTIWAGRVGRVAAALEGGTRAPPAERPRHASGCAHPLWDALHEQLRAWADAGAPG
jgi:hypothetical protein